MNLRFTLSFVFFSLVLLGTAGAYSVGIEAEAYASATGLPNSGIVSSCPPDSYAGCMAIKPSEPQTILYLIPDVPTRAEYTLLFHVRKAGTGKARFEVHLNNRKIGTIDVGNDQTRWVTKEMMVNLVPGGNILKIVPLQKSSNHLIDKFEFQQVIGTLYRDTNYGGASTLVYKDQSLAGTGVGDNHASSLKLTQGFVVTLYDLIGYGGRSYAFTQDAPDLKAAGISFDNLASSLKVREIVCGDSRIDVSEQCDDGNTVTESCAYGQQSCVVCSSTCAIQPGAASYCGDGQRNGNEVCDAGDQNGLACAPAYGGSCTYCSDTCQSVTLEGNSCGDGQVTDAESCDPNDDISNTKACTAPGGYAGVQSCSGQSCTYAAQCTATQSCGDGVVQSVAGEDCDAGPSNGAECSAAYGGSCSYCSTSCKNVVVEGNSCGDGQVTDAESCDPNDDISNTKACTAPGGYAGVQSCNGQSCTYAAQCTATQSCGDGVVQASAGEQCDSGSSNGQACNATYGGSCSYCDTSCKTVALEGNSCGDGQVTDAESCDPNNDVSTTQACTATSGYAGVQSCNGQSCTYAAQCTATQSCGDGVVQASAGEQCDSGSSNGQACTAEYGSSCSYCTSSCHILSLVGPACGDGVQDSNESCDDGSENGDPLKCNAECTGITPALCGNSVIEQGEVCDSGPSNGNACIASYGSSCTYCSTSCQTETLSGGSCGDGKVTSTEVCDPNDPATNTQSCITPAGYTGVKACNAFCSDYASECTSTLSCGDGTVQGVAGEDCDAGSANGNACNAPYGGSCTYCGASCKNVTLEGNSCGDGQVTDAETCDPNDDASNTKACTATGGYAGIQSCSGQSCTYLAQCTSTQSCGDGVIQASVGEQCDSGSTNGQTCIPGYGGSCSYCDTSCKTVALEGNSCGDGQVTDAESCDPNNDVSTTQACTATSGYAGVQSCNGQSCTYAAQCTATQSCGDGVVQASAGEQCDSGSSNGQACNATYGGSCSYCGASCKTVTLRGGSCGDGSLNGPEVCEGTAFASGASCSSYGFVAGDLSCDASCDVNTVACTTCGDGEIDLGEECDGGSLNGKSCTDYSFAGGTLGCTSSCLFTTNECLAQVCGNGIIEGTEDCDGGNKTCTISGKSGTQSCNVECTFDSCVADPLPDLIVLSAGFVDSSGAQLSIIPAGQPYYEQVVVQNKGGRSAGRQFYTGLRLYVDGNLHGAEDFAFTTSDLAPDETRKLVRGPLTHAWDTTNTWCEGAKVDSQNNVAEDDETNNEITGGCVSITPAGGSTNGTNATNATPSQPESSSGCTDSDGGIAPSIAGSVLTNGNNNPDACEGQNILGEAYCYTYTVDENHSGNVAKALVNCDYGCEHVNGVGSRCADAPGTSLPASTCSDTDGGKNPSVQGTTTSNYWGTKKVDSCDFYVPAKLNEFYCGRLGYLSVETYDCGCLNGVCSVTNVTNTTIPPPVINQTNTTNATVPTSPLSVKLSYANATLMTPTLPYAEPWVTVLSSTTDPVTLTLTGCPSASTCTLQVITGTSGIPPFTSKLIITISSSTPLGTYPITLTAADGKNTNQAIFTLRVIQQNDSNCVDTDGGRSYSTQGTVRYNINTPTPGDWTDTCNDVSILYEYYCSLGEKKSEFRTCSYGCKYGACLSAPSSTPEVACVDTDGGTVYSVLGTVRYRSSYAGNIYTSEKSDNCFGNRLIEYACDDDPNDGEGYDCPNGCAYGVCLGLVPPAPLAPPSNGTNTTNTINVTLSVDKFNPERTLNAGQWGTVISSPAGVNCGTNCGGQAYVPFPKGTSVTLTATPASGYLFAGWGQACSGTSSTCTVTLTASSTSVEAYFKVDTSTGSFPDLVVTGATYTKNGIPVTSANVGDYIVGGITLKNQGAVQASYYDSLRVKASFTKDGAVDTPNGGTGSILLTTYTLNPGQSYTRTWTPSFQNGPGLYCMKDFVADPQAHVAESDEANNDDFAGPVCISVAAACAPNWQCTSWSYCLPSLIQNRTCTDVNNCGTTASQPALSQTCTQPNCADTDGGINYDVQGTVTYNLNYPPQYQQSVTDSCSGSQLMERYCDPTTGGPVHTYYTCSNGCSAGRCN